MTEKEFCSTLEGLAEYMRQDHPNSTTLNITITTDGYISFVFEDWDKPEKGSYDFTNVKRRNEREGLRLGDGNWEFGDGESMNKYYESHNILKEVG